MRRSIAERHSVEENVAQALKVLYSFDGNRIAQCTPKIENINVGLLNQIGHVI